MSMIKNIYDTNVENYFIFNNNQILVKRNKIDNEYSFPDETIFRKCLEHQLAKDWFAEPTKKYTALLTEDTAPIPAGFCWIPLRLLFAIEHCISDQAARALAILNWRKKTQFCSICGAPMIDDKYETARCCSSCSNYVFPSISPCIIVLIHKGDSFLLARHAQRNTDVYTCLAGYVEPGESIENCVHREIMEEVGLNVNNLRYVKSQHWPFPDQLMLGFHADYESGEIKIQPEEIDEANWFTLDSLPSIPKQGSIAYQLIKGEI